LATLTVVMRFITSVIAPCITTIIEISTIIARPVLVAAVAPASLALGSVCRSLEDHLRAVADHLLVLITRLELRVHGGQRGRHRDDSKGSKERIIGCPRPARMKETCSLAVMVSPVARSSTMLCILVRMAAVDINFFVFATWIRRFVTFVSLWEANISSTACQTQAEVSIGCT
jgi:hypothetical protein